MLVVDIVAPAQDHAPMLRAVAVHEMADPELESRLKRLAGFERKALTVLLAHLGEFDRRRLYADRGQPSMFQYCVSVLGYSEQAAYKRIQAARAARAHPLLLEHLWRGELHLASIVVLAPHLRTGNLHELIAAARGKTKQELEILAAGLAPRPETPDLLRALPSSSPTITSNAISVENPMQPASEQPSSTAAPSAAPQEVKPLAPERFLFRFTGSADLQAKYSRLTKLMGFIPNGRGGCLRSGCRFLARSLRSRTPSESEGGSEVEADESGSWRGAYDIESPARRGLAKRFGTMLLHEQRRSEMSRNLMA
jgi:hypothetical protein